MIQTIRASQWILLLTGAFCILTPNHVVKILPYLVGGSMSLLGGFSIADWSRNRKKGTTSTDLAYGLVLLIIGISFVFQGQKALFSMGIVWAMIGIRKAAQTLIRLIDAVDHQNPYWYQVIEFCVRILLALLLLFDPYGKFTPHLRILGAELIVHHFQLVIRLQNRLLGTGRQHLTQIKKG